MLQVGFDMIDAFAQSHGISMASIHFKALFGEGLLLAFQWHPFIIIIILLLLFKYIFSVIRNGWWHTCSPCKTPDVHES